jgi:hypothetical protein
MINVSAYLIHVGVGQHGDKAMSFVNKIIESLIGIIPAHLRSP